MHLLLGISASEAFVKYCISSPRSYNMNRWISTCLQQYIWHLLFIGHSYRLLCIIYLSAIFFLIKERAKTLYKQTKGQRGCFKAEVGRGGWGHVLLQIPKTRCAVGPLYCQHVWMPCSINFSLNSLTRIYETCNMGLQLFWSRHTCSTRCRLHSHFEGGKKKRQE